MKYSLTHIPSVRFSIVTLKIIFGSKAVFPSIILKNLKTLYFASPNRLGFAFVVKLSPLYH